VVKYLKETSILDSESSYTEIIIGEQPMDFSKQILLKRVSKGVTF